VLTVVGEKAFQTMNSQMLVATKRDTGTETIALLEFIEKDNNKSSGDELDYEEANTSHEVTGLSTQASENVNSGLAKGYYK
jgi:hypothetical protein